MPITEEQLIQLALQARSTSVDGTRVDRRSIDELIALVRFCDNNFEKNVRPWRLNYFNPPAAVGDQDV